MGYRIDYGQPSDKRYPPVRRSGHLGPMVCTAFLLFLLLTHTIWPSGREMLRELLIPGNADVTSEAFSDLVQEIRAGVDVKDAVTTFCREILYENNVPG